MAEDKKTKSVTKKTTAKKADNASSENQPQGPGFGIEKLFLKDVSVEVPNSPEIFTNREAPKISIELNNNAKPLSDGFFEVALQITVTSKQADQTAFLIDVTQAGIFAIKNVPEEGMEPVLAITCPNILFPYAREAISDLVIKAGFSPVLLNPINFETFLIIFPYALILSAIGLIESLLTLNLVGEITNKRGGASQECLAQGFANTVTGFFGGMGGCAMIGQSMINVKSGGRTRIAGIAAALFLLIFILYTSSYIEMIPIAALVGVMFMVVIGTFAWNSLKILFFVPKSDALVIVLVTVVTVLEDLAVAVIVGVIVSALVFAWKSASRIRAVERPSATEKGAKVYEIEGPLFFSSTDSFLELFKPEEDPEVVIIDFAGSKVIDQSALKAIEDIADKYNSFGKKVKLRHLTRDCHRLLSRAGQLVVDSDDDPDYGIAVDYDVKLGIFGN